jgi:hypothetical protein
VALLRLVVRDAGRVHREHERVHVEDLQPRRQKRVEPVIEAPVAAGVPEVDVVFPEHRKAHQPRMVVERRQARLKIQADVAVVREPAPHEGVGDVGVVAKGVRAKRPRVRIERADVLDHRLDARAVGAAVEKVRMNADFGRSARQGAVQRRAAVGGKHRRTDAELGREVEKRLHGPL